MQTSVSRLRATEFEYVPSSWTPHISRASSSSCVAHFLHAVGEGFLGEGVSDGIVASAAVVVTAARKRINKNSLPPITLLPSRAASGSSPTRSERSFWSLAKSDV